MTSSAWLIVFGYFSALTVLSTCPMVWCILSIREFPCGFLDVDVECLIPFLLHMLKNSVLNSGPWSVTIVIGFGYLASQLFSTAAATSSVVVLSFLFIYTKLVHASIIVIAWNVSVFAINSISHGPIESQWTSFQGIAEASLGDVSPYTLVPQLFFLHVVHCSICCFTAVSVSWW